MKKILWLLSLIPLLLLGTSLAAPANANLFVGITSDKPTYKHKEPIALALTVLNLEANPYQATFTSSQKFDFFLYDEHGQLVWKWSGDKMFAQVISTLNLEPNKPLTYVVTFNQILPSGKLLSPGIYKLVGVFCAKNQPQKSEPIMVEIR